MNNLYSLIITHNFILNFKKLYVGNITLTLLLFLLTLMSGSYNAFGQTILINPASEGGFENGNTFAKNGWTVSNSENNPWVVGSLSNGIITGNAAFISDNGTTPNYSISSTCSNYFWRDVTVPTGETKINLTFNWACQGETNWDLWQVFVAPTSVTPVASNHPGSGSVSVPTAIEGAICVANGNPQAGVSSVNVFLPNSLAGTTFRLIFHWKSDTSFGNQPPASIDNISLTSSLPGNYFSVTSGNWSNPSTWNTGIVPTIFDNVTIASGTTVTINANNQSANNIAVNGTLNYSSNPSSFTIAKTLIVGTTGIINGFNGVTGKSLIVGGDIVNNGTINLSVGTTNSGNLTLNGSALQNVSGSGIFVNNTIGNLTCSNTSTSIPNINWGFNNISVAYNLNISNAKINLGNNKLIHGLSTTVPANTGTFTSLNGGFTSGTFSRWWNPLSTGYTNSNPTTIPVEQAGRYPFVNSLGQARLMYIGRTSPVNGGQYAITYTDATSSTVGLNIIDDGYTVTDRFNGKFQVSTESTSPTASSYIISLFTPEAYAASTANSRIVGQNSAISGTNQSTFIGAAAQRSGVSEADLLALTGLYIGVNNAELLFASVTSGSWENAVTWNKGTVPTCTDDVIISSGHVVSLNGLSNVSKSLTINGSGTLKITDGDLTVGCTANNNTFVNNGTLTVSGGILNVNGSFLHNALATFNQSGGAINIDGNDSGLESTSVASGTAIVQLNTNLLNWTDGVFTIVDPHAAPTATNTLAYSNIGNSNATGTHVFRFGNGTSTNSGGQINGFRMDTWVLNGRLSFNDLIINGGTGNFRAVTSTYSYGINGNLTITSGSQYVENTITTYLAGNLNNNGTYFNTGTLYLGSFLNGIITPSSNSQTIAGTGLFANQLTASTANLRSLTVNNNNATGVILGLPLSISANLNMLSGIINSTSANYLTLGNNFANATLSGTPSATSMIKGPFVRVIGNGNNSYLLFPVGKSNYSPISLLPTTTSLSVIKAEVFDNNTGTTNASIKNLSTNRRWTANLLSGAFTEVKVRLGDDLIESTSIPVQALTASGVYSNSFGNTATFTAGTPNQIQSNAALNAANFTGFLSFADSNVCTGTPTPGNTIASTTTICFGSSVSLSLQNQTTGVGITYQWKSATDGVNYTNISGATNSTLFIYPSIATSYLCEVTCTSSSSTTLSIPVQINFSSSIVSTTPSGRCGIGSVNLGAIPSSGAIINWYESDSSLVLLATGNTFSTPQLTETTTYYAVAEVTTPKTIVLGLGTMTSNFVGGTFFPGGWGGAKTQYIIKAAELLASGISAGNITSLGFEATTSGQTYQGFTLDIGATDQSSATTAFIGGLTQVYKGTESNNAYTPAAFTLNTLNFGTGTGSTSEFLWDGISNIVVSISWSRIPIATTSTVSGMKVDNVGFVSTAYRQNDNVSPAVMQAESIATATTSNRPKFTINGVGVCSSIRVPVVATVTTPPAFAISNDTMVICSGQSTTPVTITTNSADFDSYVWSPSTGISGNATTGWTFNPTTSTAYTLTASQTSGGLCVDTATFDVTVNPTPSSIVIAPINSPICADAILPLTATGGNLSNVQILNEKFNAPTNNWTKINTSTGGNVANAAWVLKNSPFTTNGVAIASNDSSQFYFSNSDAQGFGTITSTYLISPSFSTLNFSDASLKFYHHFRSYTGSTASVQYSLDGTDWVDLSSYTTDQGFAMAHTLVTVPLPAQVLNQASVKIRFYYAASYGYYWAVDNVSISGTQLSPIIWSPTTNLYTDAAATISYTGTSTLKVYYKSPTASGVTNYSATASGSSSCSSTANISITTNDCSITFANLESPGATTIATCNSQTYYAQVYKIGVTETSGQGAGITAWIGKNTTNTDPATWAETSWKLATFNTQSGTNDEYQTTFGPSASGTFYVASRFKYAPGSFVYGGYSATGGGIWNGTNNGNGVLTVNVVIAPTAFSQIFCNSATVSNLIASGTGLKWYTSATGGTALTNSTALTSGNYYVSQTISGCESARTTVAVTVNSTIAPTASSQTFCGTATVSNLTANGTGLKWYSSSTGGTALINTTTLVSGNYYVSQTISGCESARTTVAITVNSTLAPAASSQTFCGIATVSNLIASGIGLQWYASSTGGTALINTTALVSGNYYVSQTINGCESTRTMVSVTVNSTITPTASAQTFCGTATVSNLTASGTGLKWYTSSTGGTALINTTALVSGNYYVSQTISGCESARTTVAITVNSTLAPAASSQTFCGTATVSNLNASGTGLKWYTSSSGGTALINTTALVSGNYYVSQTISGCESARTMVAVTVNSTIAPTASAQTFCGAATVSNLVASGTELKWYTSSTGGTALANTTALVSGNYYVSQTISGCESARTMVAITVNSTLAPTAFSQTFCGTATVSNLNASGTGLKWYTSSSGGTALINTTALVSGNYYVSQTISGCESARRMVAVTVNSTIAPTASSQTFCGTATVSNLIASGTGLQWYTSATGGTALTNTTALVSGNYYVSQTLNSCESERTMISATVNATAAPIVSAQTFCIGATVTDLVAIGTGLQWYSSATGGTTLANTTTLVSGNYYVSQTLSGCSESPRTLVAVTINSTIVPTAVSQTFCGVAIVENLIANGTNLQWYATLTSNTPLANITAVTSGNYYVSQTLNGCESERIAVAITLNVTPVPTSSAQIFCNSATVEDLVASGTGLKWYETLTGGTALANTTALSSGNYYVSQTLNSCESERTMVVITVNATAAPTVPDLIFCGDTDTTIGDLGSIGTGLQWYTNATGGSALANATTLASGNYYVSQTLSGCTESPRSMVVITVNITTSPIVLASTQTFCENATVTNLVASGTDLQWYTTFTGGSALASTTVLTTGTYYVSQTLNGCESTRSGVDVIVNVTVAPTGVALQDFTTGQTLADFNVIGTNIIWYSDATGNTVLPSSTVLVSGTTYFASQIVNGCESTIRLAVTAGTDLKISDFEIRNLSYYPNPVLDILTLDCSEAIKGVKMYNMLGQLVYNKKTDATKVTIDMCAMATGNYILQITVKGKTKNVKVIKK